MARFSLLVGLFAMAASVNATLDPAKSNSKGKYSKNPGCAASKVSKAIQAAECAHNTRVSGIQTFAIFKTDHQYNSVQGAPYGTCEAYTCTAPASAQLESNDDFWTFFWNENGDSSGVGTGCIKDPNDGRCGCENSDGKFIPGGNSCS